MAKLLIINSFGPMGSTLLSGLAEKLNFTNVPIRKLGLHQYLMGKYHLASGYMEERLKLILKAHSEARLSGGVSVLDRADQQPRALVDGPKYISKISDIDAKNIQDLYFQCRNIYCDAVTYKTVETNRDWQIELTTDIHRFNHKDLYQAYQDNFEDVRMIHLHRDFGGWLNSLASQAFIHPELINRIKFFPHMRYADYALYEEAVAAMPGLHVPFDEMFDTPIEKLCAQIAEFADVSNFKGDLRSEEFDMYGKIVPYDKAFTRFDDKVSFLSSNTKAYFQNQVDNNTIEKTPYNILVWVRYLIDMLKYNFKKNK